VSDQPQHLQALNLANQIRIERSTVRAWVKEPADKVVSRHRLADLIDPDGGLKDCLGSMSLEAFLMWGYRIYPCVRRGCYELADANPNRELRKLTLRQRRIIANALRMPAAQLEEARHLHEWQRRREVAA
jgi:hypothetical protein